MSVKTEKQNSLKSRPPIVVVLGHVDHGKSSILEAIKDLKITSKESGGITQHIGAYEIEHNGKKITFIDTPGHEAFSAMRSRGARVADIAVLVIAAEESIKPQTKEAVLHIKKSGIPMIVAINKIDKPGANPEKVKRDLVQHDVLVESMGGNIPVAEVSAKTKKGISDMLELILLVAEMEKLQSDTENSAQGVVIEAYLDGRRGPTSTLLLREGTLKIGDIVGTASAFGKVKVLEDFQSNTLNKALPSMPIIVIGFNKPPQVGEKFEVYADTDSAQRYIAKKEKKTETSEVFVMEEGKKVLNIIIKADVQGSIEAIEEVLRGLPQDKIILRILKSGVGDVNEGDIKLAIGSKSRVLAFRVKADPSASILAERDRISIISFEVIYDLAQAIRQLMEKSIEPEKIRKDLGKLKILAIFRTEKNRQIAGGRVTEGEIKKGAKIEIWREEEKVGEIRLINLQRNKKDIGSAVKGEECGIMCGGETKVQVGDILQFYEQSFSR